MKKHFKFLPFLLFGLCLFLNSCSPESQPEIENTSLSKSTKADYFYDVKEIYTIPARNAIDDVPASSVRYVIPTVYNNYNYEFVVQTLSNDGAVFNISFEKDGKEYSSTFEIIDNIVYLNDDKFQFQQKDGSDYLSCLTSHDGAGVALLTGACAGIASFIPGLQPLAFACAAETAVTVAIVAADCANQ